MKIWSLHENYRQIVIESWKKSGDRMPDVYPQQEAKKLKGSHE